VFKVLWIVIVVVFVFARFIVIRISPIPTLLYLYIRISPPSRRIS